MEGIEVTKGRDIHAVTAIWVEVVAQVTRQGCMFGTTQSARPCSILLRKPQPEFRQRR